MKLMLLAILLSALPQTAQDTKQAYLVYPAKCLTPDAITKDSRVEFPWVNGQVDYGHPKTYNITTSFDKDCIFAYTRMK